MSYRLLQNGSAIVGVNEPALTFAGHKLFVSDDYVGICNPSGVGHVLVYDSAIAALIDSIDIPGEPSPAIGADLTGTQVYAAFGLQEDAVHPCRTTHSKLAIIDTATDTVAGTVADPGRVLTYINLAVDSYAPLLSPLKCIASKRKAAGKLIQQRVACYASALAVERRSTIPASRRRRRR
jgi:hypothetical protein